MTSSLPNARVSFSSPGKPSLLCWAIDVRHVSSRGCRSARASHVLSPWLDLAEGRLHLDRLSRNGGRIDFLPLGDHPTRQVVLGPRPAHSSRGKKVYRRHPPLRYGPPSGCVVDRLRP